MSAPLLLEARQLSKRYGSLQAVDGISFAVPAGGCFGLLGPNGAGKTTTLEMLEGLLPPSGGEILFHGRPLDRDALERIGVQFQSTALQDHQRVGESLRMFASFYRRQADLDALIRRCDLQEIIDRDTRQLSGGQRQRLLLAIALVNDPDLVFLDEPTTGLDPQSRRNFWNLVEAIRRDGKTVVLTTHYLEEAEQLCDEVAIMDRGRIIAHGAPDALVRRHFPAHAVRLPNAALRGDAQGLADTVLQAERGITLYTEDVGRTLRELAAAEADLDELQVGRPTLEDLFLKLTGHALRG